MPKSGNKLGYDEYFARDSVPGAKKKRKKTKYKKSFVVIPVILIIIALIGFFGHKTIGRLAGLAGKQKKPITSLFVDGEVSIYRATPGQWLRTKKQFNLNWKDRLVTAGAPRTVLKFEGDNNIRVAPLSDIAYKIYEKGMYKIKLEQGRVYLETFNDNYCVQTKLGDMFIKQGKVLVKYTRNGKMVIMCFAGPVQIGSRKKGGGDCVLRAGEKVFIDRKYKISSKSMFKTNKLDPWIKWNLSFSGKGKRVGEELPPYHFAAKEKDIELVFKNAQDDIIHLKGKKSELPEVSEGGGSYPRIETKLGSKSFPKKNKKNKKKFKVRFKIDSSMPRLPSSGGSVTGSGKTTKKQAGTSSGSSDSKGFKHRSSGESISNEDMDRKHKGAHFHLDNERRQKRNPVKVPGIDVNAPPIGPAEHPGRSSY
ncbi:MAG: hypothetical protein K8T10_16400 [Candidatus Eremiobacteraeota bacterium]|nr:hypothetical protein [Candidatus Eremiobacteraeota bacterium]